MTILGQSSLGSGDTVKERANDSTISDAPHWNYDGEPHLLGVVGTFNEEEYTLSLHEIINELVSPVQLKPIETSPIHPIRHLLYTMKIDRFRSVWGIAPGPNMDHWAQWFPELKAQGYSRLKLSDVLNTYLGCVGLMLRFLVGGVEVDIHPLEPSRDFPRLRELCNQTGLEIGLMSVIHSKGKE